ncbi:MAG: GDP-mannose 4,6-dehydratase [Candidatus Sericytochromatia bacterium]|nr:GDP-mannose 4,6-dehydratase [Candidatus Sericytochromatia bacterium]
MKTLVTGGAGFIGSHLVDALLERGDEIYVIDDLSTGDLANLAHVQDHPRLHLVVDTILHEGVMNELIHKCDRIFHLAAAVGVKYIIQNAVRSLNTNLQGTEVVLKLADRFQKPVFIASTSEVYGDQMVSQLAEDGPRVYGPTMVGRWGYAGSKAMDEFLALAYHQERGLPIVVGRLFNTVGPRQTGQYGMVVPCFVQAALSGSIIPVYGDGQQRRCFGYVGDVVRAMTTLMDAPAAIGGVFNIGNDEEVTIYELAERVRTKTSSDSAIQLIPYEEAYGPNFEDMQRRRPSLAKIHQTIGYAPTVNLDGILDRVIAHFKR